MTPCELCRGTGSVDGIRSLVLALGDVLDRRDLDHPLGGGRRRRRRLGRRRRGRRRSRRRLARRDRVRPFVVARTRASTLARRRRPRRCLRFGTPYAALEILRPGVVARADGARRARPEADGQRGREGRQAGSLADRCAHAETESALSGVRIAGVNFVCFCCASRSSAVTPPLHGSRGDPSRVSRARRERVTRETTRAASERAPTFERSSAALTRTRGRRSIDGRGRPGPPAYSLSFLVRITIGCAWASLARSTPVITKP